MRRLAATAALASTVLLLGACGGSHHPAGAGLPVKHIAITFAGSDVTPDGTDVDVAVGQRIELDVTADAPGEIHVHSSPDEQEFEYPKGSHTFQVAPIQAPGRVVVESHTLDKTLVILVAR